MKPFFSLPVAFQFSSPRVASNYKRTKNERKRLLHLLFPFMQLLQPPLPSSSQPSSASPSLAFPAAVSGTSSEAASTWPRARSVRVLMEKIEGVSTEKKSEQKRREGEKKSANGKKKVPSLSTSSYRQVRPVEVPDTRPPLPVVPRPRRGRRPPDDGLGDAEVGVFAASAEVSVVGPRVGRGRGDHAAEQPGRLGLARHGALRESVLDVHPADELGEARELLGRDADVFQDGPGAKLPLRGGEEGQGEGACRRRGRRRGRGGRRGDDIRPCARGRRRGQRSRGAKERVEAGSGGGVVLGREGLES